MSSLYNTRKQREKNEMLNAYLIYIYTCVCVYKEQMAAQYFRSKQPPSPLFCFTLFCVCATAILKDKTLRP